MRTVIKEELVFMSLGGIEVVIIMITASLCDGFGSIKHVIPEDSTSFP